MSFTQPQSINVFGWQWVAESKVQLLQYLDDHLNDESIELISVSTANPEQVMLAQHNEQFFRTINEEFDLVLPDGEGIVIASKLLGGQKKGQVIKQRLAGVDIVAELISQSRSNLDSKLVIGGRNYQDSKLKVASGEFRFQDLSESAKLTKDAADKVIFWLPAYENVKQPTKREEELVENILNKLKPKLVFVALGAPDQEFWVAKHKPLLVDSGVKLVMVVGGAFDMLTGKVSRAPEFMRQLKLEWFWRLLQEPSRWRRQLALFQFIRLVMTQKIKLYLS